MSWQSYVDDHLMCTLPGGGQLASAAIVGQDGGVWAQSAAFPAVSKGEVDALLAGLADPDKLAMSGIVLGGEKFFSIGGEANSVIRGKKGPGGCTVKKTETALVIGVYAPPVSPGDCSVVVENLGDYLSGQGI